MDPKSIYGLKREKLAQLWALGTDTDIHPDRPTADLEKTKIISDLPDDSDNVPQIEGYQILGKLGEGGMGTVWQAIQLSTQRDVALKILGKGTFATRKLRIRFEREVELMSRLEHPHIARLYDSGDHEGMMYYSMELIEGEHLDQYVRNRQYTIQQTVQLFYTLCQAIQFAHQRGVIHRDLKPSNILVTTDGQPHILDFGMAKAYMDADKGTTLSVEGEVAGTPAYMSPEQAAGDMDAIDTRTDVYSLGIMLYTLLTQQWPYDLSGSHYQVLKTIQEELPVRPSKVIPRFDPDLEAILLKTLSKDPTERYSSVSELAMDVQNYTEGFPVNAQAVTTLYILKKLLLRHRYGTKVLGLLLLMLIGFSVIGSYLYWDKNQLYLQSEKEREAYKHQIMDNEAFFDKIAFAAFLEDWYADDSAKVKDALPYFGKQSRAGLGIRFLLDPRSFDEKKGELHGRLPEDNASFLAFVYAEYHVKNNDRSAAIEEYQKCLDANPSPPVYDEWFMSRARANLELLSTGEVSSLRFCPVPPGKKSVQ
jgi:serine/threonine protein kinase